MFTLASSTRVGSSSVVEQAAWEIDPINGRDNASGAPGYPKADFAGFAADTRGKALDQSVTITVLGDTDEDVTLTPFFVAPVYLYIRSIPAVMFSGTLTAGTLEWSNSGHQEVNAICSAIPTSWTASDLLGKPMRIASGARAGNATFVALDIGSKTARCAGWMAPGYYNDTAVSGDPFEVVDVVRCTGSWVVAGHGPGKVWLEDIEVGDRGDAHGLECYSPVNATRARVNGCDTFGAGDMYAVGSYMGDGLRPNAGATIELTAAIRAAPKTPIDIRQGGKLYVYEQCLVDGYGVSVEQGSTMVIDVTGSMSVGHTVGVTLFNGAAVDQIGYLWCRDTATRVLEVLPGAVYGYTSGRAPVNVGTGSPTLARVGLTNYSSVPQTNNSAAALVRA